MPFGTGNFGNSLEIQGFDIKLMLKPSNVK